MQFDDNDAKNCLLALQEIKSKPAYNKRRKIEVSPAKSKELQKFISDLHSCRIYHDLRVLSMK